MIAETACDAGFLATHCFQAPKQKQHAMVKAASEDRVLYGTAPLQLIDLHCGIGIVHLLF